MSPGGGRGRAPAPRPLAALSRGAYRALLRLYPARLRRRFGEAMGADLERLVDEEWRRRGVRGLASAWGRVLADLARSAPRAWTGAGWWGSPAEGAWEDVRWAVRGLRRSPAFTAVAVAVLGLGLAGVLTTLVVVDAYLVRGLPYPESRRLVSVSPASAVPWGEADPTVVEHAITWDLDVFTLVDGDRPELVRGAWISPGYAEAFGLAPALGRLFRAEEYGDGAAPVALLSHGLWQRRYGGDPAVLGRTVPAYASDIPDQAETFTVVGVLPRGFWHHNPYSEMLVPLRDPNPLYMARLRPGVPLAEAERALTAVARQAGAELPDEGVRLTRLEEAYAARVRPPLVVLGTAVGLVLLLACANAAVLLLVRTAGRERELALRRAVGAGPGRLYRQLVAEGLLLAGAAAGLGLVLAWLATGILAAPLEARLGREIPGGAETLGPSGWVVLASGGLALVLGLAFGGAGALGAGRGAVGAALAESARSFSEGRRRRRARDLLVGAELALSFALLVGAGLALRSARNLAVTDLGFEPGDRITAQVNLRAAAYPDGVARAEFYDRLAEAARGLPGVETAGLISRVPFGWNFGSRPVEVEDAPGAAPETLPRATGLAAGPGLLEALGVPVYRGRDLSLRDREGSPRAAVVSRRLAELLWPGQDPLGRRFREVREGGPVHGADPSGPWWTVVGVAGDVRQQLHGEDPPDFYVPYAQLQPTSMTVVLHVRSGAASPVPALEEAVLRLDPEVAVAAVLGLEEATLAARAPARLLAAVLGGFSAFALVLAVLGLYGVVAYAAARRSRDVAVRMALGAEAGQVVRLFLGESAPVVALGLATGVAGAALLGRTLASQLHGVSPWDGATYLGVAGALAAAATLAAWIPARRAAAADPATILREQ